MEGHTASLLVIVGLAIATMFYSVYRQNVALKRQKQAMEVQETAVQNQRRSMERMEEALGLQRRSLELQEQMVRLLEEMNRKGN